MEKASKVALEQGCEEEEEAASTWGKEVSDETRAKALRQRHARLEVVAGRSA